MSSFCSFGIIVWFEVLFFFLFSDFLFLVVPDYCHSDLTIAIK